MMTMRRSRPLLAGLGLAIVAACDGGNGPSVSDAASPDGLPMGGSADASGGYSGSGGAVGSGGTSGMGGKVGSGGVPATGGAGGGGSANTGGASARGGAGGGAGGNGAGTDGGTAGSGGTATGGKGAGGVDGGGRGGADGSVDAAGAGGRDGGLETGSADRAIDGAGGPDAGMDVGIGTEGGTWPCGSAPRASAPAISVPQTGGRNLYVSPTGSDTNDGLSTAHPLQTLQRAADVVQPGDTVNVMDGTYASTNYAVMELSTTGTVESWIVFRAAPGAHPKIKTTDWVGINGLSVAYVVIDGFEVEGDRTAITYDYALANPKAGNTSGDGIDFADSHHIIIRNNFVHDCSGGGIGAMRCDYMTVEYNVAYLNAYWSVYGNSGISLYQLTAIDNSTATKNIVANNVSYNNEEFLNCSCSGDTAITDGNGIIIDDNLHTQDGHPERAYPGRTLVSNNLVYGNGGTGMHAFASTHVDFVNNTAYKNNHSPALDEGQIVGQSSSDVNIVNNVMVAFDGKRVSASATGVTYQYNVYWNSRVAPVLGSHDLVADPGFVNPACVDFRLASGSPAIDSGSGTLVPTIDLLGTTRPLGKGYDRGAYEFVGP
jgi:hypothetical protein